MAGVKGIWAEEETCHKVSPLSLTWVIKGQKNKKRKEMEIVEVAEELEEEEKEQLEMEQIPFGCQLPMEDEMQNRISPLIPSPSNVREKFFEPGECSKNNQGNAEVMELLMSMKKEMEEREKRWEQQHKIREEFLKADFKKREQQWEQMLKQRHEEWKEEIEMRERALMQRLD